MSAYLCCNILQNNSCQVTLLFSLQYLTLFPIMQAEKYPYESGSLPEGTQGKIPYPQKIRVKKIA